MNLFNHGLIYVHDLSTGKVLCSYKGALSELTLDEKVACIELLTSRIRRKKSPSTAYKPTHGGYSF